MCRRRRRSSVERMSTAELERPSPTGTAARHVVPARLRALRPVEPPCGQEPFDDLAVVFPSRRLGCSRRDRARAAAGALGFDARASATAWLIGAGARGARPRSAAGRRSRAGAPTAITARGSSATAAATFASAAPRSARRSGRRCSSGCRSTRARAGGLRGRAVRGRAARTRSRCSCGRRRSGRSTRRCSPSGSSRADTRFRPERFAAIEHHAYERIRAEHLTRLRRAVARIAAQLPVAGLPVASATVAAGCALDRCRRRPVRERSSPASSRDTPRARSSERARANPAG